MSQESYHVASQVAFSIACLLLAYVCFAYNLVVLARVLPAVGADAIVTPVRVIFNSIWLLSYWSFIRARYSDPGILPGKWKAFVERAGPTLPIAPSKREWQPRKTTMCNKCRFPRPERSHHCVLCGHCVMRYDHHCPWINNCVGFYNHKFFLQTCIYTWLTGFMLLVTTMSTLPFCVHAITNREDEGEDGGRDSLPKEIGPLDVVAVFSLACLGAFAVSLLSAILRSHGSLAMRNLTSVEDFYENMPNPFEQGSVIANLAQIMGEPGFDWFLPIKPFRLLSDGVTFACTPSELCAGLFETPPDSAGRALLGACSRPSADREALTFDAEGNAHDSDGECPLVPGAVGCGEISKARMLPSTLDETEELWRQRYGLDERRRGNGAGDGRFGQDEDSRSEASSSGPTLLSGLWSSFFRGRKDPRRRAVWL